MMENIESILRRRGAEVDEEILKALPRTGKHNLNDAAWYHIDTGGKKLRPVLAIMTCEALYGNIDKVIPFAAACDVLHNWLLIHDDIEDGDTIRRGKETLWKKYGIEHGINVGDYLSEKVYEIILRSDLDEKIILWLVKEMVQTVVKTAEGQTLDINLRKNDNPTEDEYMEMITGKTAYYLTIPIIGGAIVAGTSEELIKKIREFGMKVGPAFQIADDVLDLTVGKGREEIGCDIKEGKRSIMVTHCLSKCEPEEKETLIRILNKPRDETTHEDVLTVKTFFEKHGSIEYAQEKAKKLINEGKDIISDIQPKLRDVLNFFADYMIERKR